MTNKTRKRKVLQQSQKIIDRRKSALLELGKGVDESISLASDEKAKAEKIKNATEKVFDRWDKVFVELAKGTNE